MQVPLSTSCGLVLATDAISTERSSAWCRRGPLEVPADLGVVGDDHVEPRPAVPARATVRLHRGDQ